jgi:hypothetical protein
LPLMLSTSDRPRCSSSDRTGARALESALAQLVGLDQVDDLLGNTTP